MIKSTTMGCQRTDRESASRDRGRPVPLERWGWASIIVNVGLSGLNLTLAYISGSLAVTAEVMHNFADLAASAAVLLGLKVSVHKSRSFPYGLYKIENVVSAGVAILVFLAAYEIARETFFGERQTTFVSVWIIGGVAIGTVVPLVFSYFEMRAGRSANSPSLVADAYEYRVHVFTSGLVLIALVGNIFNLHFERAAALIIIVIVVRTGWRLLVDAMRVLLDASLDADTILQARRIIEQEPTVLEIQSLVGRNAGRYRFLEVMVGARIRDLDQADAVSRRLEHALRKEIPFLERALVEVRPVRKETVRMALPLSAPDGPPSPYFGTAPYYLLIDKRRADGELIRRSVVKNPFSREPKGRGIKVAHWLLEHGVDLLVTLDDIGERGPGYALGEAGVEVVLTEGTTVERALADAAEAPGAR
jgi:cation diffusion facilitator family transporter